MRFRERPDAGRLDVAVLEQHQRRNAADAEARRNLLVLVDVDLGYLEPPAVFLGHLFKDRSNRLAGTAPLGPVIDQHRDLGLEDFGLETVIGNVLDGLTAHGSSGSCSGLLQVVAGDVAIMGPAGRVPKSAFSYKC